ncbi:hypothetical protein EHE19_014575 [Ruminiclostridium herbifermentans]|uniref:cellulase n=1 Tax=Ruminiclostridium herbifermentans TaxID=2488810 RepID=A0A7H1VL34_9FIRM|nr:dockerin type I repeat-containing protein [Ruminiclostridium herbifermentans]QNU66096.1 hypothetical protein EHE19_014575 [Ruminiclostridium herbifermentans]
MFKKAKILVVITVICSLLLGSTMVFASDLPVVAESESEIVYGDANGDKYVDVLDIVYIKNYLLGKVDFKSSDNFIAADVNGDEGVDSLDMSLIKQYLLGTIVIFPAEKMKMWVLYTPKKEDITYHIEETSDGRYQIVFEVLFPSSGYMIEYTDELAVALGTLPDGGTLISLRPINGPIFWKYLGPSLTVMTTKRIVYTLSGKGNYTFELLGTWYNFTI